MGASEPLTAARYQGPTYYREPALKASRWQALVWSYMWVSGLGGSAQVLGTVGDLLGRPDLRGLVRQARAIAAFVPLVGAGLLIADLQTPQRWYNMLRIFRGTSPMSIGTYLLGAFALSSGATAWAAWRGRPGIATAAQLPAAAAGAGMSVYTGALLGATSTPLWSAAPRLLAGRFAASSFATAAAALSIGETLRGHPRHAANLDRVAAVATLLEYGLAKASERRCGKLGVDAALHEPDISATRRSSGQIGVLLPIACLALNEVARRRSRTLSLAGAIGVLAGGLLMRAMVVRAGNRSAQRPEDAFALARPSGGGDAR